LQRVQLLLCTFPRHFEQSGAGELVSSYNLAAELISSYNELISTSLNIIEVTTDNPEFRTVDTWPGRAVTTTTMVGMVTLFKSDQPADQ
jgi:hypothetical protein